MDIISSDLRMPADRGHLLSVPDSAGRELLYLSERASFAPGGSIRGGVPIIAPWFNTLIRSDPSHGWARRIEWETAEVPGGIDARTDHDEWELRLGAQHTRDGFAMLLKARNSSDTRRELQLAFHPYFLVDDVRATSVRGDGQEITFDGSAYDQRLPITEAMTIDDGHRTITVIGHGHDHTVVWNPGEDLGDMAEGDWQRFVCVEPALLGADEKGVSVAPWEWVTLGMTVKVA